MKILDTAIKANVSCMLFESNGAYIVAIQKDGHETIDIDCVSREAAEKLFNSLVEAI